MVVVCQTAELTYFVAHSEHVIVFQFLSLSISEITKGAGQCKELSTKEAGPKGNTDANPDTHNPSTACTLYTLYINDLSSMCTCVT